LQGAIRDSKGTGYGGYPTYYNQAEINDDFEFAAYAKDESMSGSAALFKKMKESRDKRRRKSEEKPRGEQDLLPKILSALKTLVPTGVKYGVHDRLDVRILFVLLERSVLLESIATLLRSDNFEDVTSKFELYTCVLELIGKLARHPELRPLVLGPRKLYSSGLLKAAFSDNAQSPSEPQLVTPLIDLLEKIHNTSQKFKTRFLAVEKQFDEQESQQILRFCAHAGTVFQAVQDIQQASTTLDNGKGLKETQTEAERAIKWHREHCVTSVDDPDYEKSFVKTKSGRRLVSMITSTTSGGKGRMKRLLKEIASLESALPAGIFVRYGESRPDLMKVLIIGPTDTPYENGLFEFQMTFPAEYPQQPPAMHFLTTGGGQAAFNPNLYPEGKVCLSLLGTWQGPGWDPQQSTVLQVLVSMQAMVFCAEPWYNEPGRETRESKQQSERYNIDVSSMLTLRRVYMANIVPH
jgi:baculoviral IAP repeat-containing protein 6